MPRLVAVVPHTHWDREWYAPFQTFRLRLVDLLDDLLDRLDADPSFRHFLLDGQMAVVDDYLAVRPEAEHRLRRLAGAGRLAMGPWYTLPDEFLVSGETLIRNLELGRDAAARFGGAMPVGYLPDMFGHIAQMPQLLRQFGFEHAVVWRGVPGAVDRSAFCWVAPDGSAIRAEYLPEGYGNGAFLPDDAKVLLRRVRGWIARNEPLLRGGPVLWMNGTDHQVPRPWVGRVVAEAADLAGDEFDLRVASLAEYLAAAPTDGLPVWRGELRSSARANLLMGVTSNRVDVRRAAARAERAIESLAEPLCALFLPPALWPGRLLHEAWMHLVRNAAHDSVCACSDDEVVDAVLHRYAEARHIGEGLADRALRLIGAHVATRGPLVVNPTATTRSGLVELRLPGQTPPAGTQLLSAEPADELRHTVDARDAPAVVRRELDLEPDVAAVAVERAPDAIDVTLHLDPARAPDLDATEPLADLAELARTSPDSTVRVRVRREPQLTVLARVDEVPGFSWRAWSPAPMSVRPVSAGPDTLDNGLVSVRVDPTDGTFAIDGLAGLGRLVDGGDAGDTYNFSPPAHDRVVDRPERVEVSCIERGPLRARLRVVSTFRWPAEIDDRTDAREGERLVAVETLLELRAGERLVRLTHTFDNPCRDHRLRVVFPLPEPATVSRAECAFAVVERGLTAEGGPTELGLPTFPSRRFVTAGGLTFVHEGLPEYELTDISGGRAHALAVTLLRATRYLSRGPMATRPLPAGPVVELRGSQVPGRHTLRSAVHVGDADPYRLVEDAFVPLLVATGAAMGPGPAAHRALEVHGAEVSAVRRVGGALQVRVFNPTAAPVTVQVPGRTGWVLDLRGAPVEPFSGEVGLGPWRIATLQLDEPGTRA